MVLNILKIIINFIASFWDKIDSRRKHIKIESINVINDRNNKDYIKLLDTPSEFYYSNLIYNIITVQNNSEKTQAITSVRLKNVQLTSKFFPVLQYDGGFINGTQEFCFMLINNGNETGQSANYMLKFYATEQPQKYDELLLEYPIKTQEIEEGQIKIVALVNYLKNFKQYFEENDNARGIRIEVIRNGKILSDDGQDYNREQGRFVKPLGRAGISVNSNMTLFRLSRGFEFEKELSQKCHQPLDIGTNTIDFYILTEETASLRYEFELISGNKRICPLQNEGQIKLDVFVPCYKVLDNHTYGKFYEALEKQRIKYDDVFTVADMKLIKEDLIYNIYRPLEKMD
ncbi:hypothetical protein [Streptococcus mutans]|uniref:hypothetical protein n=1 Tax=Streptococcus mutans TaxID=1309 RepID=UPI0002B5EB42|nr:hypothetical protein [Streptococcus mutans]EMB86300.1 hypothetical protein SMU54_03255 [Streptococcus mutans A9]EMC29561.1 hypothetical protein SMU85_02194 [Streptococcus mutans ST6]MDT9521823.1 hypothetical protein [Streptococcus mutans]